MRKYSKISAILIIAAAFLVLGGGSAWAVVGQDEVAKGYTNKSTHSSDQHNYYKKPGRSGSYTGPFDYGSHSVDEPAPRKITPMPEAPVGKCNCFTFDGTRSFDPDRQKLSYSWDFGDGQTSDQPVVKHCYDKAGEYTAVLTVRDSSGEICGNGVATTKVSANFPPTADAGDPAKVCVGENASFSASKSTTSGPATYTWDFGDGEKGEGEIVSHSYQKAGTYRVSLLVNDGKNTECSVASASTEARVMDRVTVALADGKRTTCVNRALSFNANGTGGGKYSWDFGDGATASGSSVNHAYTKAGEYTVTVTADNGQASPCSVAMDRTTVRVYEAPVADAGENLVCCVGKDNMFDGSKSTGTGLSYHWDFGDGEKGEGVRVSHAYSKPGSYRVVLTVKDDSGSECSTSSDSFVANVNAQPEAVIEVR